MATNANININISSKGAEKSLNTLYADLEATREELDRLIKTYGENSKQADTMRKNLVGLEGELSKFGGALDNAANSQRSLKSELRQLQNELAGLEPGSARFQELSDKAGQLRDKIQDTNAVINATAGSGVERLGKGLTNIAQIGVAGFQAIQGGAAALGIESKDLEKTMVQLQGLLNLSQALETFGGLGDKITEIKAGFSGLLTTSKQVAVSQTQAATSTAATTIALEGEAVAAGGAATTTTALGFAMNALPLVAIATALGLVIASLITYASKSKDAEKQEELRKKNLEELKQAQEQENKAVIDSSKDYVALIYSLKETNANSKERKDKIDEINKTYGTTFKNLQDEAAFQNQLNLSVKEYIALQVARIRAELNKEKLTEAVKKLDAAERAYNESLRKQQKIMDENGMTALEVRDNFGYIREEIDKNLSLTNKYTAQVQSLSINNKGLNETINNLTDGGKKYIQVNEKSAKSIKDVSTAVDDYSKYLDDIQKILEENTKVEEENFNKVQELSDKKVDLKDIERRKLEENIRKIYEANKKAITVEVQDEKKRTELLKANEDAYTKFIQTEYERRSLDIQENIKKRLDAEKDLNNTLILEAKALQNEIRFGDGDTSDTLISNQNKITLATIKELETRQKRSLIENRVKLKNELEFLNQRQELQKGFINSEDTSNRQAAKAELDRLLALEIQKYEISKEYFIKTNKETGQIEVGVNTQMFDYPLEIANLENLKKELLDLNKENLNDAEKTKKKKLEFTIQETEGQIEILQQASDNAQQIQANLNKVKENLNEEYNQKLLTQSAETNEKLRDLDIETQNNIFEARIDKLSEYIDYAQQLYNNFNSIVQQAQEQRLQNQEMALDSYVNYEQTKLQQQLANNLMTQEEYDARVRQLETKREQDILKLKRKQFKTDKALNLTEATIDGARATLSTFAGTPGGIVIKSIAAGIAAAFSAVQIALIAKQQFTAAIGGIVPDNNQSRNVDSIDAKLAPGEAIINSNSTSSFLPLLSMINQLGGGKSLMPDLPGDNGLNRFQPVYSQQNNQPVRAYVVNSDIENNMSKLDRIRRSTRF